MDIGDADSSRPFERFGYTAKVMLAKWLDERISLIKNDQIGYFVWFAERANEYRRDSTSNPIRIYETLDNYVNYRQVDRMSEFYLRLVAVVEDAFGANDPRIEQMIAYLEKLVQHPDAYRPQLWRIDLARWDTENYEAVQGKDHEFRCTGYTLQPECFTEVIV